MATPDSPAPGSPDDTTACRIVRDLDSNFIVEAGAGTGKTYALVSRVIALVKAGPDHGGARMEHIVAITFTETAAAELSERIRSRMEQLLDATHDDNAGDLLLPLSHDERERVTVAIEELDQATIQTIHSFAGQLLRERPMDVGLPPGWLQLDALAASQRFDEQWDSWLEWALGNGADVPAELRNTLRYLVSANIGVARWQGIARAFSEHYEKLRADHTVKQYDLAPVVQQTLEGLQELIAGCGDASDRLYQQLAGAIATVEAVSQVADDPPAAAQVLEQGAPVDFANNVGAQKNWTINTKAVRDNFRESGRAFQETVRASALAILLRSLRARFAVEYEAERKSDGVVTFTDLLVWARDILRDNAAARHHFQRKYSHILIDEFQDTDPLQAEIAFYLAAAPDADVIHQPWYTLPLSTGKLFLVGDSKQSIYRFRGADVSITARVKAGGQLQELTLTENRRSQQRVLDWVNATFSQIMVEADDEAPPVQAEYLRLEAHAAIQQPSLGSVTVFGGPVLGAAAMRRMRSQHIARLIAAGVSDGDQRRQVYDQSTRQTRPASRRDFCILIRERTGLGILQWELDAAGIPYRIEGGSLLFDTQEVQDLLNCLQAIDDPTDAICVAAALRSPAFACSDADLLRWRDAGGPWDYLSVPLDGAGQRLQQSERRQRLLEVSPVWAAMGVLRDYHGRRQSLTVASLIGEFVRERRLEELDLAEYRAREIWRRRQFIIEQARSLEATSPDTVGQSSWNLHQFIRWANHQRDEHSRITETAVPESDDDAVRIMTMHSAKGLEFPIVILQDLDIASRPRPPERVLFNSESDTLEVNASNRIAAQVRTGGYARVEDEEKRHAVAEKTRLAYVAATRARDHLLVSLYHADRSESNAWDADQAAAVVGLPVGLLHTALPPDDGASIAFALSQTVATPPPLPPYDAAAWQAERTATIRSRSVQQAVTATWLARQGAAADGNVPAGNVPADDVPAGDVLAGDVPGVHQPATLAEAAAFAEIEDKEGEPDPEQPWRKGRGGTAFGSAVHAVLQGVVEELSPQLPLPGGADLDALLAALHPDIVRLTNVHAAAQDVPTRRDEVVALVERTLRNPEVVAALRAHQRWPELPVAAPVDTSRGPIVIEGIIDLLYEDAAGELVILDYKSDDVRSESDVASRMRHYKYQGAAYAAAVERATGRRVSAVKFLFLRIDSVQVIEDIPNLIGQLPALMIGGAF